MGDAAGDSALVEAWRCGDAAAGEELFRRHFTAVSRFFRNKLSAGVEDLIQQTFVALVEGRERLRAEQSFRSYLFGIAHNVLRAHLRALDRARRFDPTSSSIMQLDPGPSTMHAARQEQRLLLRALRRIPMEHQVALELVYWEGLNAAEIAAVLGVPHSTMRSRIQRARALLEQAIEQLAQSPGLSKSTVDGLEQWAAQVRELAR
ncbi:MAG: sigma-70 family RNA polymerase sigma factor [Nannocystaceae bacterium]